MEWKQQLLPELWREDGWREMKMQRLIDANAMYQRYCVEVRGLDGIYDATDLPDMLAEMPTINAIPIEWMEKRWRETLPDGVEPDFDINYAFQEVMSEWRQEQEAR